MDLIIEAYQDLSDNIEQPNYSNIFNPPRRKRSKRVRFQIQNQQVNPPVTVTTIDDNLIGHLVCGVVEDSFDEGYILNLKIKDATNQFQGFFIPKKVTPKMDSRTDIRIPSLNQQTQDKGKKKLTWKRPEIASGRTLQEAITSSYTPTLEVLQNVENLTRTDQQKSPMHTEELQLIPAQVKEVGGLSTEDKQTVQRILDSRHKDKFHQLMLVSANDDKSREYYTSKKPEDSITELYPDFIRNLQQSIRSNIEEVLTEEKLARTQKSPMPCGRDLMVQTQASPMDIVPEGHRRRSPMDIEPCGHDFSRIMSEDNVPEELQLRLWPLVDAQKQNLKPVLETKHERPRPPPCELTLLSTKDGKPKEGNTARRPEDCAASKKVSLSNGNELFETIPSLDATRSRLEELRKEEKLRRIQQQPQPQQQQQLEVGIANESHKRQKLPYKRRTEKATGKDQDQEYPKDRWHYRRLASQKQKQVGDCNIK